MKTTADKQRAFLIPSYNAGPHVIQVLSELKSALATQNVADVPIVIVDDGSTDGSLSSVPSGVTLLIHNTNLGKGAALKTGLRWAREHSLSQVVTLDADGQHPAHEAVRLFLLPGHERALVLGVRDLKGAGAPRANQRSNSFSNRVLSLFGGEELKDTQCGLRRYPVEETLALGSEANGYAFESDLVLRAARRGLLIHHVKTEVRYPKGLQRVSHFDSVRDPARIVCQVVSTTLQVPHHRARRRWFRCLTVLFLTLLGALAFLL